MSTLQETTPSTDTFRSRLLTTKTMNALKETATTLLSTDAFRTGLLKFITDRYCVVDPDIKNLQIDISQPPSHATWEGDVFIAFLYTDQKGTEDEDVAPVLYYGTLDGTGTFQDDVKHHPDCSGMSCQDYGCPLIDDGEDTY